MKDYTVVLVGLSQLFQEGLQLVFRRSRFALSASTSSLWDALESHPGVKPNLAVCYCTTNEEVARLLTQMRERQAEVEDINVVLLADGLGSDLLRTAAAAGVKGVLSKDISSDILQRSLELVMLGQQLFPGMPEEVPPRPASSLVPFNRPVTVSNESGVPAQASPSNTPSGGPQSCALQVGPQQARYLFRQSAVAGGEAQRTTTLSDRERQILRCLVDGSANKTIARELMITEATVKVHIKGLLRKIRVNNRTQAAVWGLNNMVDQNDESATRERAETTMLRQVAS